jgi:hypothetical protein
MPKITDQILEQGAHWFELADRKFDAEDCPLWNRPLRAALFTAEMGVERTYDRNVKEYEDILIGNLFNAAKAWYHARYGVDACRPANDSVEGVVLFRNTPVALSIPLTMRSAADDDEHVWLRFLTRFTEVELPATFLRTQLPLDSPDQEKRLNFETKIKSIVTLTRSICTSVRSVDLAEETSREMCHSVVERLSIGASLIQQGNARTRALAIWEFFFAIELLLKTFIIQRGEIPEHIHVLKDLQKSARRLGLVAPLTRLSDLPSSKQAIQHRYAQKGAPVLEAMKVYNSALKVGAEIVSELKLLINGDNPSLLLKTNPGWIFPPM